MRITYHCAKESVAVDDSSATILDISTAARIPHLRECGGRGACTTCRVRILEGIENVTPRTRAERAQAEARNWDERVRLACQTRPTGDVELVRLLKTSAEVSQLQLESLPEGGGEEREVAILFCDMRNFTPMVESSLAYDVVHILNRLFGVLGDSILLNSGLIYQYVGDEITGLFGLDGATPKKACYRALRAGMGMLESLEQLNQELDQHFSERLAVGIGIHYGPVIVGRVGHPTDRRFAVVGDAVNVASRIQSANKALDTSLLVSGAVLSHVPASGLLMGKSSSVELKGKQDRFDVHEIRGFTDPDPLLLVQSTWQWVQDCEPRFGDRFYERLFEQGPELAGLFSGNISSQSDMLAQMLNTVIYATDRPQHLALGLVTLGRRHLDYGVEDWHYDVVRQVMLETLSDVLGGRFTPAVEAAWDGTLQSLIDLMRKGAPKTD